MAARATVKMTVEPRADDGRRPDFTLDGIDQRIMSDVCVTHPPRKTSAAQAAQQPLYAARERERQKHSKYRDLAAMEERKLLPFVVETLGAIGAGARSVIASIAADAEVQHVESEAEFTQWAYDALSVAIQRGNALATRRALMGARGLAGFTQARARGGAAAADVRGA